VKKQKVKSAEPKRTVKKSPKKVAAKNNKPLINSATNRRSDNKTAEKTRKRNFFAFPNKKESHPQHVYAKQGNKFKGLEITHAKKVKGKKLKRMIKNPDPSDTRSAYFVTTHTVTHEKKMGKPLKNWQLSKEDNTQMKKYRH